MKIARLVIFLLAMAAGDLYAQGPLVNSWVTPDECQAAVAPFYKPEIIPPVRRQLATNEMIAGHDTALCVDMDLPETRGRRGWVRTQVGREFVYDRTTGRILRLAECDNVVHAYQPIIAIGPEELEQARVGGGTSRRVVQTPNGPISQTQTTTVNVNISEAARRAAERERLPAQRTRVEVEDDDGGGGWMKWVVGGLIAGGVAGGIYYLVENSRNRRVNQEIHIEFVKP